MRAVLVLIALTAMAYQGKWNASQAVPEHAVAAEMVGRYGSIDRAIAATRIATAWQANGSEAPGRR